MCVKLTYLFHVLTCDVHVESRSNPPSTPARLTHIQCFARVTFSWRAARNSSHVDRQRDEEEPHTAFDFLLLGCYDEGTDSRYEAAIFNG